jgi:hypothetical protein
MRSSDLSKLIKIEKWTLIINVATLIVWVAVISVVIARRI